MQQIDCKIDKYILTEQDMPLNEITTEYLQIIINKIKSARTQKYLSGILSQTFKKAIEIKIIDYNPTIGIETSRYVAKQSKFLTPEEIKLLMQKTEGQEIQRLYKFYLLTGVRRNEALALRKPDIDFEHKLIHIRGTKTESSDRYIPLFNELIPILKDCDFKVFKIQSDKATRVLHEILPNHHLHELRHTFASNCLAAGIDIKVIQAWLGHKSAQTTMNIYAKVNQNLMDKSTEMINNLPPKLTPILSVQPQNPKNQG